MKGTGWHEGWYMAVVNDVLDMDAGRTSTVYVVEPSEVYEISVKEMLEEETMLGSLTGMKWNNFTKGVPRFQLKGREKKSEIQT